MFPRVLEQGDWVLPAGMFGPKESVKLYARIAGMAVRRPRMIPYLIRAAWAFRARDWYRKPPFLPLPPRSYLRWRLDTAYGDPDAEPPVDDFERYLVWSARMRREMTGRRHE